MPGCGHYCASKFGVVGLTNSLAVELGEFGIRVNSVHPYGTDTPMGNDLSMYKVFQDHPHYIHSFSPGSLPTDSLADPDLISDIVVWLASDASSLVTAAQIPGYAVFARAVLVGPPVALSVDVISEGRSTATAVITAQQNDKRCITMTVLADVPTPDVIRHHLPRPDVAAPADSNVFEMPMIGRELRLVDVVDVNSPDEVGPPGLYAWLHYDPIPTRDDLAKALIADFAGHLGISTTMRAHEGIGTSQAHLTVSTAPMTVTVSFHEPVSWSGWLLYTDESTQVGARMSYVRGAVHTEEGELVASFAQDALHRPLP